MNNIKVSRILEALNKDGWVMTAQKGSHRQFKHPVKPGKVTVNGHPSDVVCGFLLKSIEAQSGLKFNGLLFNPQRRTYLLNLNYSQMERIIMNTGLTETGYSCSCDLLPGWIVSGSNDFEQFKKEVKDSIDFYIECAKADGDEYPSVFDSDYEVVYKFDVRSLLEYYRGIFSFSALQTITGINQKQLAHYASGVSKPRPQQVRKIAEGLHSLACELLTITV